MRFLSYLLDFLYPPRDTFARVRDTTPAAIEALYEPQRFTGTMHISVCMSYRSSLARALIQEAKFENTTHAQEILGRMLARFIREELMSITDKPLILIPLPLSATRRAERGYNQVEKIVGFALPELPGVISMPEALTRLRATLPQTSLSREERLLNVRGAFGAAAGLDAAYLYIVVDDVVTTGATLRAAVEALSAAGMPHILPVAVAS